MGIVDFVEVYPVGVDLVRQEWTFGLTVLNFMNYLYAICLHTDALG